MQSKIFIKWTLQKSLKNYYYFKLCLKVNYMKLNFLQNTWRPLSSTEAISALYFKLNYLMIMFFAKKITTCFFCNRKEKFYHAKSPSELCLLNICKVCTWSSLLLKRNILPIYKLLERWEIVTRSAQQSALKQLLANPLFNHQYWNIFERPA